MRLDLLSVTWVFVLAVSCATGDKVTFQDEPAGEHSSHFENDASTEESSLEGRQRPNRTREGKDLLDWIGLGTGQHIDPYVAKTNEACLNGDFAECFKSRALNSFTDFFDQQHYNLNENVKVVKMPSDIVKEVSRQPYEYSSTARSDESEWDQLVKFAMRKAEKFIKSTAIEVNVPAWLTGENEVYAPRFLDEIADEIDTLENKKDTLFSRNRLKRLFIPLLIILKLFKLKLLLFLPLILGLASFKKFLGFLAIIIPGLIAFFKLGRPIAQTYTPPIYSPSGIGFPPGHYKDSPGFHEHDSYRPTSQSGYHDSGYQASDNYAHELAYQGYRDYQN